MVSRQPVSELCLTSTTATCWLSNCHAEYRLCGVALPHPLLPPALPQPAVPERGALCCCHPPERRPQRRPALRGQRRQARICTAVLLRSSQPGGCLRCAVERPCAELTAHAHPAALVPCPTLLPSLLYHSPAVQSTPSHCPLPAHLGAIPCRSLTSQRMNHIHTFALSTKLLFPPHEPR